MSHSAAETIAGLVAVAGADAVIIEPSRTAPFTEEPRRRFHTPALAVAVPRSVEAMQAVVRWAAANAVPLIPQSGNTGLVGGQVPLAGHEVIVSSTKLAAVRDVDATAGHMTLEAGVILEDAHKVAEEAGTIFPLWLASQGSARIGGLLASNAGGVQVLAYGNARELCLGVEAVLADGSLYNGLNALKKNNTGYDLKNLLVGSEGTLGIITAATLKLFPKPEAYATALVSVDSPDVALNLFALMRKRAGPGLTAFELMNRLGIDLQLRHGMIARDPTAGPSPWYCLIELAGIPGIEDSLQSSLESALEAGLVTDAVVASSLAERTALWTARENFSEVQSLEGASIKHDVSVPVAAVPRLIAEGSAAVERIVPGIRPCPFGHMGDGNIHFNLSQPVGADHSAFMAQEAAVNDAMYEVVLRLGGSVSAEHGIGQLKVGLLERVKDPVALQMMRAIKRALDPQNILNPGKMLSLP